MIGVVIWGIEESETAVIWCEDKAAMVYLNGRAHLRDSSWWPGPGDLVELDNEIAGNRRHARRVSRLPQNREADIPQEIRCPVDSGCTSLSFPVCSYSSPPCKQRCG